jgi:hypothetical protein
MKLIFVKGNGVTKYGSIKKTAEYLGVHPNTLSRYISAGDRIVYIKGFEVDLKAEKFK